MPGSTRSSNLTLGGDNQMPMSSSRKGETAQFQSGIAATDGVNRRKLG